MKRKRTVLRFSPWVKERTFSGGVGKMDEGGGCVRPLLRREAAVGRPPRGGPQEAFLTSECREKERTASMVVVDLDLFLLYFFLVSSFFPSFKAFRSLSSRRSSSFPK